MPGVVRTHEVRGQRWRTILLSLMAGLLLALVVVAGYLWSALTTIAPRTQVSDLVALLTDGSGGDRLASKVRSDQRINILFLGYGGPGHDGPYLTDSMLLLSIKPLTQQADIISIPRDLVVPIPALPDQGTISARINLAYAIGVDRQNFPNVRDTWRSPTGGGDLAAATVAEVSGRPVDYWVAVDFKAFRRVVDALGGSISRSPSRSTIRTFPLGRRPRTPTSTSTPANSI